MSSGWAFSVMDRGRSDVVLDYARANPSRLERTRACQDRSSMPRPLECARAGSSRGPSSLESSSIGLRSARACSCATLASKFLNARLHFDYRVQMDAFEVSSGDP